MSTFLKAIPSSLVAVGLHLVRQPRRYMLILLIAILSLWVFLLFLIPPRGAVYPALVVVEENVSFRTTARVFKEQKLVRSALMLEALARSTGTDRQVNAGLYLFEKPQSLVGVWFRLITGIHGVPTMRVTFPEGASTYEMGAILQKNIPNFDKDTWQEKAGPLEGYLFPDTYDFYVDVTIPEILEQMQENFAVRTKQVQSEALLEGKNWEDIVTMASLIEKEANTEEDRHLVSGILWSRIEEGVALQVDAVFPYIRQNPSHVPNGDDPEVDSPYNTYLNRGLPPGPISNPGLEALDAALHPTETDYFYYLTGKDGKMYYAENFEAHKQNQIHL